MSQLCNKCSLLPHRTSEEDINLPPNFPGRLAVCVSSGLSTRTGVNPSRAVAPIFIALQSALPAPTLHSTALSWSIVNVHHAWSVRESPSNLSQSLGRSPGSSHRSVHSALYGLSYEVDYTTMRIQEIDADKYLLVYVFADVYLMWGSDAIHLDLHFCGSTNFEREVVSTKNVLDRTAHLGILRPHTAEQLLVDECVFKLRCRPGLQSGNSHTARHGEDVVRGDAGNSFNLA